VAQRLAEAIEAAETDSLRLGGLPAAFDRPAGHLARLAGAFAAVAAHTSPAKADELAQRLAEAIEAEKTDPDRLDRLAGAFAAVAAHTSPAKACNLFRLLAASMQSQAYSGVPSPWSEPIANLPDPLDPSDLANVLKYPNCTGKVRSAVLGHLAKVLQIPWKPTDNPWPLITHPKLKPYVDRPLVAPPARPTK
jgi:hypothetical protein